MRRGVAGVRLCHASPCKYPAGKCPLHDLPRVGESIDWSKASHPPIFVGNCCDDMNACLCGYAVCSCTTRVIDAEFSEVEPEPPKDVLPEGWTDISTEDQESYRHWRGVHAWRTRSRAHAGMHAWGWCWALSDRATCRRDDCKPTRELAMVAALQSVKPALRPGWQWNEGDKRWDHKGIDATAYQSKARTWVAIKWGGRAEPGHPTLEVAQIRAEALARGES